MWLFNTIHLFPHVILLHNSFIFTCDSFIWLFYFHMWFFYMILLFPLVILSHNMFIATCFLFIMWILFYNSQSDTFTWFICHMRSFQCSVCSSFISSCDSFSWFICFLNLFIFRTQCIFIFHDFVIQYIFFFTLDSFYTYMILLHELFSHLVHIVLYFTCFSQTTFFFVHVII